MKYLDEYRDPQIIKTLVDKIHQKASKSWSIMEVCGGQTHSLIKYGIDQLLEPAIKLVHGPGCPVCVTPTEFIDKAIAIAKRPQVIFCSFGDMLRVPGSCEDLLKIRAQGAVIKTVYSPLEAVTLAQENPDKEVVFFAVGFETTAPANALTIINAEKLKLKNFRLLVSQVLVPPAVDLLMDSEETKVDALLAAGHVCTIMGQSEYLPLSKKHKLPIVITGFEPVDLLKGILAAVKQLENKQFFVENQYARSVKLEGNIKAQQLLQEVFKIDKKKWRGMGELPASGLTLQEKYRHYDAELYYQVQDISPIDSLECISGDILRGIKSPKQCPKFGNGCSPEFPLGATMVSTEGACSAYYQYRH